MYCNRVFLQEHPMKRIYIGLILVFLFGNILLYADILDNQHDKARKEMVGVIEAEVRKTKGYLKKAKLTSSTMNAIAKVKRHEFVPILNLLSAYDNRPLSIGYGQTISQPYIVAIMTDLLNLKSSDKVLEIGTGSGYQAAVLAEIVKEVYTIEVIRELGLSSSERLQRLGYKNVYTKIADGYYGWESNAPYDAIIVTAAAGRIPPPLLKQLKPGGRMIIPVKSLYHIEYLILVSKDQNSTVKTRQVLPVRFVPLTGKH